MSIERHRLDVAMGNPGSFSNRFYPDNNSDSDDIAANQSIGD